MNKEEIEKAFKKLIYCSDNNDIHHSVPISLRECNLLMNEFNNLQQENKQLKEVIETLKETNKLLLLQKGQLQEVLDMLDNRIDKAIEYLDKEFPWEDGQPEDIFYILEGENNE